MDAVATELPSAPKNRTRIKEVLMSALNCVQASYIYETKFNIATVSASPSCLAVRQQVSLSLPERSARQINDMLLELEDYGIECLYNIVLGDLMAIGTKSPCKRPPTYHLISDGFIMDAYGITILFRTTPI